MTDLLKRIRRAAAIVAIVAAAMPAEAGGQPAGGQRGRGGVPRPQRDADRAVPAGTASISGRVLAGDTGRPLKRARVVISGGGRPLSATTDNQGRFTITGLPAGTFNLTAAKSGYVDAAFGQRRASRSGAPIPLADGQQLTGVEMKLPRGGVITGRIVDEDAEPLARAVVSVLRYQYVAGRRQLVPAGADQTDDRGQYRVFGLPAGEYIVSATAGGIEAIIGRLVDPAAPTQDAEPDNTGYAPTYFPGVIASADAARVKVAASEETQNIDFQLQIVPLAVVRGMVSGGNAVVMLLPEGGAGGRGAGGGGRGGGPGGRGGGLAALASGLLQGVQTLRSSTHADGTFSIANVPPGTYTIVARAAAAGGAPRMAVQTLPVLGQDVYVALTPVPGVTVSGSVTLEASAGRLPQGFNGFRITPAALDAAAALPRASRPGIPDERGQFSLSDVMAGRYIVRTTTPRGWTMKAVYLDGRDVTDQPFEVKGETISGLNVIFTDRVTGLGGAVRDARGAPAGELTVIAFSADDKLWYAQSRYIQAARTDRTGVYRLTALPPGDYHVAAVDDVEQGEWFDPAFLEQVRDAATRVTLGEGEQRSQDLKAPS
jgi:hypothetical protein